MSTNANLGGPVGQQNEGDHYVVISADSHAGADLRDYKPYLEKRWHDDFEEWASSYTNPWEFLDPKGADEGDRLRVGATSWLSPLNWDSKRRLADLEADGVVAEVVFPNTAPPFLPSTLFGGAPPTSDAEYQRRWAGLKAHNRWLVDFCADAPGRRAGVIQLMLYNIDDAVSELQAALEAGLTGGVLLPPDGTEGAVVPLYRPELEPLWA